MKQTIKILIYWVLVFVTMILSIYMIISPPFSVKEKQQQVVTLIPKAVDCSCSSTNCKTHTFNGNWTPTDPKCFSSDKNCFYCCLGKEELIK